MNHSVRTLHSYLSQIAASDPHKRLLGDSTGWLDAQTLLLCVESAAAELTARGIRPGSMVAVRTTRSIRSVVTILALEAIGAVAVLTDPRQEPEAFLAKCEIPVCVQQILDPEREDMLHLVHHSFPLRQTDPHAPGFVIFTSGSTGLGKAVTLSQYNVISNLEDAQPFGDYRREDVALGVLPFDHIFGLVLLTGVLVLEYSLFLPEKADIPSILQTIEHQRITRMNGVPSLYLAMAEQKRCHDLSSLRVGFIGGGPCTPEQFRRIEGELGITLIPAYGMSECVSITIASPGDSQEQRADSVGRFYPRTTGKILLEDGTEAPCGTEGEIFVDSPSRMLGYYPSVRPNTLLMSTGDLGYQDADGLIHITGRKKDVIIRNGYNLSARRIEEALLALPGVSEAVVVGLPHPTQGEVPAAMAVSSRTEAELLSSLEAHLKKNEMPAGILIADALPYTASGKPDKQRVKQVLSLWTV